WEKPIYLLRAPGEGPSSIQGIPAGDTVD
ncbi:hypothetical protein DBR06_SOUSAS19710009, partial [Sousa chinensis]